MDRNSDAITFSSNTFIFGRTKVANFADIIKIAVMFNKTTFKDLEKLEIMD